MIQKICEICGCAFVFISVFNVLDVLYTLFNEANFQFTPGANVITPIIMGLLFYVLMKNKSAKSDNAGEAA